MAKRISDQPADTDSTNIPGFNVTGQPTTEGYGLGLDFLTTDHNRANDNIDITDASNAIHTSNGYNVFDSNSVQVSGHAEAGQRNDTGGDQRLQDTLPERATEGRRRTYSEGLPWPSEIVANTNTW